MKITIKSHGKSHEKPPFSYGFPMVYLLYCDTRPGNPASWARFTSPLRSLLGKGVRPDRPRSLPPSSGSNPGERRTQVVPNEGKNPRKTHGKP